MKAPIGALQLHPVWLVSAASLQVQGDKMRGISVLAATFGLAAALAGCGKSGEQAPRSSSAPQAAATAAAPAASPADQQKILAALPAPYNTADPANGEAKFALCRSCHSITKGGPNLTGPNLWGIYGTKAAEVPDFSFSEAMKASGLTWDAATIDKWIADPRAVLPQTKMVFLGVKDPKERADIVAYLALQRDK
jgi:cytochrome c